MNEKIKKWICDYYKIDILLIEDNSFFNNELVTSFLIIWTIFEQKLFNGFVKRTLIEEFSSDSSNKFSTSLSKHFKYFYERYHDKQLFKNLINDDKAIQKKMQNILEQPIELITDDNKLTFILYVLYRYRNNIFHGNKGVELWTKYSIQIEICISIMIELLHANNNTNNS